MRKIFFLLFMAAFSLANYSMGQQGKPTTPKPSTTAKPKPLAAKAKPIARAQPATTAKPGASSGHKQEKIAVGVTGITTNFAACAITTVKNVTLDYWPANAENVDNPKKIKKQFVRVEIDVLSNCDEPYTYNFTQYRMKITDGSNVMTSIHLNALNVPDQKTETLVLAKGQNITTALYFEVPDTETLNTLSFIVNGYDEKGLSTTLELKLGK